MDNRIYPQGSETRGWKWYKVPGCSPRDQRISDLRSQIALGMGAEAPDCPSGGVGEQCDELYQFAGPMHLQQSRRRRLPDGRGLGAAPPVVMSGTHEMPGVVRHARMSSKMFGLCPGRS
jgi:hypothetical protein